MSEREPKFEEIVAELASVAASAPDCQGALVIVKLRSGHYAVSATHDGGVEGCVRLAETALLEMRRAGPEHVIARNATQRGGRA